MHITLFFINLNFIFISLSITLKLIMFLKVILNYIIGSEEPPNQCETTYSKRFRNHLGEKLRLYRKYLKNIWIFFFPKLLTTSTLISLMLLVSLAVTEVIVYQVGLLSGKFYKVLTGRDLPGFRELAFIAIAYIVLNASLKAFNVYLANLLSIVWRETATFTIHKLYFYKKQFYYLHYPQVLAANSKANNYSTNAPITQSILSYSESSLNREQSIHSGPASDKTDANLDNLDQRITQDVKSLGESMSKIVPIMLITPFLIGWYGYRVSLRQQKILHIKKLFPI